MQVICFWCLFLLHVVRVKVYLDTPTYCVVQTVICTIANLQPQCVPMGASGKKL